MDAPISKPNTCLTNLFDPLFYGGLIGSDRCPASDCKAIYREGELVPIGALIEPVRLHRPVTIVTDKAHTYQRVIREINRRHDPHFDSIRHIDRKWRTNLIESDHAALKRLLGNRQSFQSLRTAKATLSGIETIRNLKRGQIHHKKSGGRGEIAFINDLFQAS